MKEKLLDTIYSYISTIDFNTANNLVQAILNNNLLSLKPLSDIVNSREDCEKVFNFISNKFGENPITEIKIDQSFVMIESKQSGFGRRVFIDFKGSVEHQYYFDEFFNDEPIDNIF